MILQADRDLTLRALLDLSGPEHVFYLDGSRYHQDAKEDSDYDVFVQEHPGVNDYLTRHQWRLWPNEQGYHDSNSVNIYSKGKVHVITVKDAVARLEIQRYMQGKTRSTDVDFWSNLYDKYYRGELHDSQT